jgi:hypothetical protein
MNPPQDDGSGLVRWLIMRDELRVRARRIAQHVSSMVKLALKQPADTVQAPAPDLKPQQ